MDHRIDLEQSNSSDLAVMRYNGEVIGQSRYPLYEAARWLLRSNHSLAGHTLTTYRNGKASMHGSVEFCARWMVTDTATGTRRVKYVEKGEI